MKQDTFADELNRRVEQLLAGVQVEHEPEWESLLSMGAEVSTLPNPEFKMRLKADLSRILNSGFGRVLTSAPIERRDSHSGSCSTCTPAKSCSTRRFSSSAKVSCFISSFPVSYAKFRAR